MQQPTLVLLNKKEAQGHLHGWALGVSGGTAKDRERAFMHAKSNAPVLDEKGTSTILERPDSSPAELSAAASTVEASSYADADPQGRSGEFSRIEKGLAALTRLLSEHANAIVAL